MSDEIKALTFADTERMGIRPLSLVDISYTRKSEAKKADAFERLNELVEGKGDSFNMLCESKNLTYRESELIVDEIKTDISKGLVEPSRIDGVFLTKRFNEYIENEKQ